MKHFFSSLFFTLNFFFCFSQSGVFIPEKNFTQYVDPFIGTGGHGHTFPGATTPFGMVQLSPDTRIDGSWDGCSGYHYSDSVIYGFSHTHLSGTGCSDYGDIMIMPTAEYSVDKTKYSSKFSHKNENATTGFYSVKLEDDNIDVELTATTRVGLHKYTFHENKNQNIVFDLTHRDKLLPGSYVKIVGNNKIEGCRVSQAWAQKQFVYYTAEFSEPFNWEIFLGDKSMKDEKWIDNYYSGENIKAIFSFNNSKNIVYVKISISAVGVDGARKNMEAELPGWDFEKVKKEAEISWNKELSKIEVTSKDEDKLKIFYTALYHTMIQPNIYNDVDHRYRGRDNQIHTAGGFNYYTVFSLWDTFRAAHPLYAIIERERTLDFIKTFIAQYEQGGRLPVWELSSNETDCMIGYHSVSVIADAFAKGVNKFNYEKAFEAMKASATWNHYGLPAYMEHGYIGMEDEAENVSRTLEYSYDDWCISQMAQMIGKRDDYPTYIQRSQYWKNIFDSETDFTRPKKNGSWLSPFDPKEVNNNYTEANTWQYTFFVPQEISGLINFMGGYEKFEKKLDELFSTDSKTTGREQSDITGLIGQYAHGNEPSHHMAYLYDNVACAWKTQERVHQIMTELYHKKPNGLAGNEDCGQMSAWYVFSAMGFYPVSPGSVIYSIGTPLFNDVKIHLENGHTFEIKANNVSENFFYIQSAKLDGEDYSKAWIQNATIIQNGELSFEMGSAKNPTWGLEGLDMLNIPILENEIIPVPLIKSGGKTFKENTQAILQSTQPNYKIHFTTDGTVPSIYSQEYKSPISIVKTTTIRAIAVNDNGGKSFVTTSTLYKNPHPDWKIKINSKYTSQYSAGGDEGVIDGLRGDINWRKGDWQGYQGQDFECIIDLNAEKKISKISAGFLQDEGAWILMPTKVEYYFSNDGENFSLAGTVNNTVEEKDEKIQTKDFAVQMKKTVKTKFVKVKAYNYGKLPPWHAGAGSDAYIFTDEIMIE